MALNGIMPERMVLVLLWALLLFCAPPGAVGVSETVSIGFRCTSDCTDGVCYNDLVGDITLTD